MSSVGFNPPPIFGDKKELIDSRQFYLGEIWQIRDALISIPDADRVNNRTEHYSRTVVIVDNNSQNYNPLSPTISVVPLSHRTDCIRELDIILREKEDQVNKESILRLPLVQPVLKKDLFKCVGTISNNSKDAIIDVLLQKIGVDLEEF